MFVSCLNATVLPDACSHRLVDGTQPARAVHPDVDVSGSQDEAR